MSLGVIACIVVMSVLAFLLTQWQLVTVPVEAAARYVPRPMVEMVTGWETVDYMDTPVSSVSMHNLESERDSASVDGPIVTQDTRTGHPWWWQIQS